MNLVNEHSAWLLWGLVVFVIVGIIAFFLRNHSAKIDGDPQPQERPNESGVASIVKTKKQ